jgi:hypothetical protein
MVGIISGQISAFSSLFSITSLIFPDFFHPLHSHLFTFLSHLLFRAPLSSSANCRNPSQVENPLLLSFVCPRSLLSATLLTTPRDSSISSRSSPLSLCSSVLLSALLRYRFHYCLFCLRPLQFNFQSNCNGIIILIHLN